MKGIHDNTLRVSFNFVYPNEAALVVYKVMTGGYFGSSDVVISKVITGIEAVKIYSGLTGESIESLKENAGYTKRVYEIKEEVDE